MFYHGEKLVAYSSYRVIDCEKDTLDIFFMEGYFLAKQVSDLDRDQRCFVRETGEEVLPYCKEDSSSHP